MRADVRRTWGEPSSVGRGVTPAGVTLAFSALWGRRTPSTVSSSPRSCPARTSACVGAVAGRLAGSRYSLLIRGFPGPWGRGGGVLGRGHAEGGNPPGWVQDPGASDARSCGYAPGAPSLWGWEGTGATLRPTLAWTQGADSAVPYKPLWSPGLLKPSVGDPADSEEGCCSTPFFLGRKNIPLALVLFGIDLFQVPGTHLHGDYVFSRS